jgi:hypothetical protein
MPCRELNMHIGRKAFDHILVPDDSLILSRLYTMVREHAHAKSPRYPWIASMHGTLAAGPADTGVYVIAILTKRSNKHRQAGILFEMVC